VAYTYYVKVFNEKSVQSRRKHCTLVVVRRSQKKIPTAQTPCWGRGMGKNNQLEMVTTLTLETKFGENGCT